MYIRQRTKSDGKILTCSRSHNAVIRVYDERGNVIETHEHKGRFQGVVSAEPDKKPPRSEA
jgi:hypothetical protein